jgi:hypothetical protein
VSRLFTLPDEGPAQSLWDEEGDPILSMDDVPPGATVYISQLPPPSEATPADTDQPSIVDSSVPGRIPSRHNSRLRTRPPSPSRDHGSGSSMLLIIDDSASSTSYRSRRKHRESVFDDQRLQDDIDEDETNFQATGISLRSIAKLLGYLPPGCTLSAAELVNLVPGIIARLASAVERCQAAQDIFVFQSVLKLFGEVPPVTHSVRTFAEQLVDDATTGNSFTVVTKMRHAIIGPVKSGKSVFLRVVGETVLSRFIASGQYRKTLIFFVDVREVIEEFGDPFKLYRLIVRITFTHLAAQRIDIQPYRDGLITYFERLPSLDKVIALPGKFVIEDDFRGAVPLLTILAERLFNSVSVLHSLNAWLTNIVAFPHDVAAAFGFGGVTFFVDHLELSDFEIEPVEPFTAEPGSVTILEYLKFMLSNDSFVISGTEEEHLIEGLELLTEDGIDLRDGIESVSIVDIDTDHSERFQFTLRLVDDEQAMFLRLVDCGGCPGYLSLWDPIIEQAERVKGEEKKDNNSRIARELRLELLAKLRVLASLLFWRFDNAEEKIVPLNKQIVQYEIVDTTRDIPEETE